MTKEEILRCFSDEEEFWHGYNCGPVDCVVVTKDYHKALLAFDKLFNIHKDNCLRYEKYRDDISIILKTGEYYKWVKPSDNARGHRFASIIIDTDIDEEIFHNVIRPITRCGKNKIQFLDDFIS